MADNIAHGVPVEGTNVAIGTLMRAGSSSAAITVATVITTSGVLDLSERTVRLSDSDLAAALTLSQHEQAGAKGVHRLILAGCTLLSDASMHTVCANCDLYELDLSGCHGLSDAGLQTLVTECEHLTTLILHDLTALTDDAFAPLSGDCKGAPLLASLSTLNLSRCQTLTDGAISLLAQCPLKDLNVSLCKQLGAAATATHHWAGRLPCLERINLTATAADDTAVSLLAEHSPCLRWFNATRCPKVGDSGVMALAAKCSGLLSLYAVRTPITDAALLALGKGCGGLRELHVAACLGLSDDGLLVTTQPLKLGD
uniref:Uncharacterized protein n=1 Tax=Haptolina ericina TaxID=156174 RepID=A0A7S3FLG0_9EUKA